MSTCPFDDRRDDILIAYLYDELDAGTRAEFSTHLLQCTTCRDEVVALKTVRTQLASWTPPVFGRQSSAVDPQSSVDSPSRQSWWREVPAWARVAAAIIVLGVAIGAANLNIHYDQSGVTVRTGWLRSPDAAATTSHQNGIEAAVAPAAASTSIVAAGRAGAGAPWQADLVALARQLRTEFHASQPSAVPVRSAQASDAETIKRVRALVDESERKQQRELALRVAEVVRDVQSERRADLVRIEQSLGQIQSNTGVEVMKQRQLLNYLVRVSQRQ
jgi:anti-sigma factor RsiW